MVPTTRSRAPTAEAAEALAVQALAFIAGDTERLGRFLAETGLSPETIRRAAEDPAFLPSVLDYLIANEALLVAFATEQTIDPGLVVTACAVLPGVQRTE